jgi:adenylate cyclase
VTVPVPEAPAPRIARVRIAGTVLLVLLTIALALNASQVQPLQSAWFDAYQALMPRQLESTPVTIVAIDEKSLAALGRWPWPRTLLAQLIHTINAYSPAAIGIDIVMPEPDPLSPNQVIARIGGEAGLLDWLAALPSNDDELARALAAAPTVLMMVGTPDPSDQPIRVAPVLVQDADGGSDAASHLAQYPGAMTTLPSINDAASGWGLVSADDTHGGVVRTVPLVSSVHGTLVPSLTLDMWRVAMRAPAVRLRTRAGAAQGIAVGDRFFPTAADGSIRVYFSPRSEQRFVSAVDVLAEHVDPKALGRSFVLIGVTSLALGDYVWTPVGKMPGSEVHAQVIENLNDGSMLVRPAWARTAEAGIFLLLGALLVWTAPRWPVTYASVLTVAIAVLLLVLGAYLFRSERLLLDAATPAACLLLLFGVMLALTLADATRNRKALQRVVQLQREESARVAGELQAARRIQMETLPRPGQLRDPRVELAASMEPALEVGGDLYDFYPIDDRRLFFMLGDVSGKGLSASIFMAVSKALCKSTMLRSPAADLGALVSAANAEVARDNPGALFVTVFAGVVDLESGALAYCNAGQEHPWLLRAGDGSPCRLDASGGPPLCAVDDFVYESAREELRAGDLLCIVSDGVTEAQDPDKDLYGSARVERLLAGVRSAGDAVAALRADVASFAAGAEQSDDMTILALRWRGPSA